MSLTPPADFVANSPPVTVAPDPAGLAARRFTVQPPAGSPSAQSGYALIINSSAYPIMVDVGGRPLGYLPPGISNAYNLGTLGAPIGVTVPPATTPAASGSAQQVFVTWSNDPPPGQWPSGVNTQQIAAAISGAINSTLSGIQSAELATGTTAIFTGANTEQQINLGAVPSWVESIGIVGSVNTGTGGMTAGQRVAVTVDDPAHHLGTPLPTTAMIMAGTGLGASGQTRFDPRYIDLPGGYALYLIGPDNGAAPVGYSVTYTVTGYGVPAAQLRPHLETPSVGWTVILNNSTATILNSRGGLAYLQQLEPAITMDSNTVAGNVIFRDTGDSNNIFADVDVPAGTASGPSQFTIPAFRVTGSLTVQWTGAVPTRFSGAYRAIALVP